MPVARTTWADTRVRPYGDTAIRIRWGREYVRLAENRPHVSGGFRTAQPPRDPPPHFRRNRRALKRAHRLLARLDAPGRKPLPPREVVRQPLRCPIGMH